MKECDNSTRKIHISSNFMLSMFFCLVPVGCRRLVALEQQFLYFEAHQSPVVFHCPFVGSTL